MANLIENNNGWFGRQPCEKVPTSVLQMSVFLNISTKFYVNSFLKYSRIRHVNHQVIDCNRFFLSYRNKTVHFSLGILKMCKVSHRLIATSQTSITSQI